MSETIRVPGLAVDLRWRNVADEWHLDDHGLTIVAPARTDLFHDPQTDTVVQSAPMLVASLVGDFLLRCRVTGELGATFDAGALVVWVDEGRWAKLALERSPENEAMLVSVVTRGRSDDANGWVVGDTVWLRVARIGRSFAFHASDDGQRWRLVRHFTLDAPESVEVGFLSQSPRGPGCRSRFEAVDHRAATLADLRDGS